MTGTARSPRTGLTVAGSLLLLLALLLSLFVTLARPAAGAGSRAAVEAPIGTACTVTGYEVTLTANNPMPAEIFAQVCVPDTPKGVQVLLHGSTMRRSYWDFGGTDDRYSYVSAATERGWATVAVDRLGAGSSTRPPAEVVTNASSAATVHQVIDQVVQQLNDRIGRDLPVVLVGHSQGSSIAIRVAAEHPQTVDALVTTGFLHHSGPAADLFLPALHPAAQDPGFPAGTVPDGYLTTKPGLRVLGYDAFHADPRIVARDEATKSTTTMGEVIDFATEQQARLHSREVTQPVLAVLGSHDVLFCAPGTCAATVRDERDAYPTAASVTGRVVPDAGHNLGLQHNAKRSTRLILDWIDGL